MGKIFVHSLKESMKQINVGFVTGLLFYLLTRTDKPNWLNLLTIILAFIWVIGTNYYLDDK